MTDNFERAKDKILRDAKANGGVTVDHLFDALIATNADLDSQHEQTRVWHDQVCGMVADHIEEAKVRDKRIDVLEEFAEQSRNTCKERVERLIAEEHDKRHSDHMEEFHAADADYRQRLMWFLATSTGKVLLLFIGALAVILLNYLVYGRP